MVISGLTQGQKKLQNLATLALAYKNYRHPDGQSSSSSSMAVGNLLVIVLAVWAAPAAMQVVLGPWAHVAASSSSITDSIVSGVAAGADSLRRTLQDLNATAANALPLAQDKVHLYVGDLAATWRWTVSYAQWLNPDVAANTCQEEPTVRRLLEEVELEALNCVRDRVPKGVPDIVQAVGQVIGNINDYVDRVHQQAELCDEQTGFMGAICKATQVAPLGGQLGLLGGQVGAVSSQLAVLVDGSARHCTVTAAHPREAQALAASLNTAECIRAAGGNQGTQETARYFARRRNAHSTVVVYNSSLRGPL
ncbi:Protein translocase subunit [Frankliniella fusca]|uniref:Protein translocase subunit n=1 Tax=Frankliniella fusca TaxID=407009 RepID=A0AAE1LNZ0_9NEOP|nr:Protein translocase subunit [Frankliniella fusca]